MTFALADRAYDAQLLALTEAEPMPGRIRIRLTRAPSFLDAITIHGRTVQVPVLLNGQHVIGAGLRCRRLVYLNGEPTPFGYLGGLHLAPAARSGLHLARAYRYLRELHEQAPVPGYLTTIMEANHTALQLLRGGRAGLPDYLPCGHLHCLTYARHPPRAHADPIPDLHDGEAIGADALTGFLAECGRHRPCFPVLEPGDFGKPWLRGLALSDFMVLVRDGRIHAAAAVWDQRRFRQTVIDGYAPGITLMRPLLNAVARVTGRPCLPRPGNALPMAFVAFLCVRDNDPASAGALLDALRECPSGTTAPRLLTAGIHAADPLAPALLARPHVRTVSRIFIACWPDTRDLCNGLPGLAPHLEPAML